MQYLKLLDLPGLYPMSRFQLAWAILMFVGMPALDADDRARAAEDPRRRGPFDLPGRARDRPLPDLPRHVSFAEARRARRHPAREGGVARYGGLARFLASAAIEIVFSFLLGAVSTFRTTLFMIGLAVRTLGGLGRAGARRAGPFLVRRRARACGRRSLFGVLVCGALGGALAGGALVEPAADRRLSGRDPLRGLDRVGRRGGAPQAPRAVRHPRGVRAAGRNPAPCRVERGARSRHGRGGPALARDLLSRSRPRPRPWTRSMPASSKPAISPSTSAPMSATASPPSAASAPASSRSSRSPGRRGRSG